MTTQEFRMIASNKLSKLSTEDLILEVKKFSNDFSKEATLLSDIILDILMERMQVQHFIKLCTSL